MNANDKPMVFVEGGDFTFWSYQIQNYLDIKGLSKWLVNKPSSSKLEEVTDDKKARACVAMSLSSSLQRYYFHESDLECTKDFWERLCKDLNQVSAQQTFCVIRDFFSVNKEKKETVRQFETKLKELEWRAKVAEIEISDELYVCAFVSGVQS